MTKVRTMNKEDISRVSEILCDCYRWLADKEDLSDDALEFLVNERGSVETVSRESEMDTYVVAVNDGEIVGMASIKGDEITKMYVAPRHHRKGIGRALFAAAERIVVQNGHDGIILGAIGESPVPFYKSMGMTESGRKAGRMGNESQEVILMEKNLWRMFIPPKQFIVYEAEHWLVNHRVNSALPGYLMVGSKAPVTALSDLREEAHQELGVVLAKAEQCLKQVLSPVRIYIGRFGHMKGFSLHFHVIPVTEWVVEAFEADERYRSLQAFYSQSGIGGDGPDGADLMLYIWREFCESPNPPEVTGPSVEEAIGSLRLKMKQSV